MPVSAPLALGEDFAGDFPADSMKSAAGGEPVVSNGAALGYRQVPSGAVPDPPVQPLSYNNWYDWGAFVAADQHGGGGALLDVAHRRRPGAF